MAKSGDATTGKRIVSKYQPNELRKCISENLHVDAVLKRLKIANKQTLRKHLHRLMNEDKAFYDIHGLSERNANPTVHKNGILRLNLEKILLNGKEIVAGDAFEMTTEENKIILTMV